MNYLLSTNGCYNARVHQELIDKCLAQIGHFRTYEPSEAHVIIYATCGVQQMQEEASIENIRDLMRKAPDARLIVSGCLPGINQTLVDKLFGGYAEIVPSHELAGYLDMIDEFNTTGSSTITVNHGSGAYLPDETILTLKSIRDRLWDIDPAIGRFFEATTSGLQLGREREPPDALLAARGCKYRCTYCGIWKAVGPYRSKPLGTILSAVGSSENPRVVITADELGLWGTDLSPRMSISDLADALLLTENHEYYLRNVEPRPLIDNKSSVLGLAQAGKLFYLSSPMQSASSNILKLMRRPYSSSEALDTLLRFKDQGVILETHIMVGFPGETDHDFLLSFDFVDQLAPQAISIVRYSDRPGTPSVNLPRKITEEDKIARQRAIQDLHKAQIDRIYQDMIPADTPDKQIVIKRIIDAFQAVV